MTNLWVLDAEANGLLYEVDAIHCAVAKNTKSGERRVFRPGDIVSLPRFLDSVDVLIGHNLAGYDLLLFEKVLGYRYEGKVYDTKVWSQVLNPDRVLPKGVPQKAGPHSLEAWAVRLGLPPKVQNEDWSEFTEHMLTRCISDVDINLKVYEVLLKEMRDG